MKIGVKLHDYRSKGCIDIYQMKKSPYVPDYRQACRILQAIQMYPQRPTESCLMHLATFVIQSWESDPSQAKISDLYHFMNHLLDTTGIQDKDLTVNQSIQQFCSNDIPVPTSCPSITLLFAVKYIERLKQRYGDVKGTNGCSRRLLLVSFIMATKYIHSNLKFIVNTRLPPPAKKKQSTKDITLASVITSSQLLSAPSTSAPLPLSPPVSPKPAELTNPIQYHYFQSKKTNEQTTHCATSSNHDKTELPKSPKAKNDGDNDTFPCDGMPSLSSMCSQFNYRIWRMENEFLHFLNDDIKVPDCIQLVMWANQVSSPSPSFPSKRASS